MKENKKTPDIRFKGFTDDWEQRKLGKISDKVINKNQNATVKEVFTNSAEFGIVSQRDFFEKDIANTENINGYYIVEPNDFVYNPRISTTAPFGPIKRNKLGRIGAMSPLYYVFRAHDINLDYLECYFQTTCWHAFMRFNGNSGARSDRFAITDKIFNGMPIFMSQDVEEQKLIGNYFSKLDNLITLHQRECDQLKELKKTMLKKMFPRDDSNIPEVRFAGFTDDWEQRKLGKISDKVINKNQNATVKEVFTNSAEFGIVSQRDFFEKDIANTENINGYYIVEPNDFVYNPRISTTAPFGPIKRNKLGRIGAMSPLYYVFRAHDINLDYLECYFQTTCWHAFMRFNGNSGARSDRFAITDKIFNGMPIFMSQDVEEQKLIGNYFSKLDNLITLHQRELEILKNLKKTCLKRMFI